MIRRIFAGIGLVLAAGGCGNDTSLAARPAIGLSNTFVPVDARLDAPPVTSTVTIVNAADGTLENLSITTEINGGGPSWLAASLDRTSATRDHPADLTLTVNPTGLALGSYSAKVLVAAPGAGNGPLAVNVQLNVRPRPPTKLKLLTQPSGAATNGAPIATGPVVQLLTSADENALEAGILVVASITGGGTLAGTTSVLTNDQGQAAFPDITITGTAGTKALVFSAQGLSSVTSSDIALAPGAPKQLLATSGVTQTNDAGKPVSDPPRVKVVDQSGNGIGGFTVAFQASAGSTVAPSGNQTTASDGSAGLTSWTLNAVAGPNTVTVTGAGLDGSPLTFTATGRIGAPATLAKQSGDQLLGIINSTLGTPHVIKVADAAGNGVPGVAVTWAATGGGSVTPTTGTTDGNGVAAASRTLGGTPGAEGTTATVAIGAGSVTVAFTVTAVNAGPAQIVKVSGDNQSAQSGTALTTPIKVQVLDGLSAPVANVTVTFTTPNLGGSFPGGASILTDAGGFAATTWKLGSQSGPQAAQAAVGGPAPVVFSATALSGPVSPTQSTIVIAPATITASTGGSLSTITVTARDASGNLVSGANVVVAVTGTGSVTQPSGPTGGTGQANGTYSSTVTGAKTVSATVNGIALTQTGTITVQAGPAKNLAAVTATGFSVTFGSSVSPSPKVHVTDQFGNAAPGVSVGFAITGGNSSLANSSVATDANGDATVGWAVFAVSTDFTNANVYNRMQASVGGAAGSPVTFTGTVNVVHYTADIQPIWNGVCNSCHTGHNHPELNAPATTSYTNITNPGLSGFYVVPGDSVTRSSTKNMLLFWPPNPSHGGCCVASNLITIIAAWIKQGAPQN